MLVQAQLLARMAKKSKAEHLNPRDCAVKGGSARKAWWYENDTSIDVVIESVDANGVVVTGIARIQRASLAAWLARTENLQRKSRSK